jgi:uncharacterized protein YndB with AHSA1/START domain
MNNIFLEVEAPALLVWKNTGERRPGGPPDIVSTVTLEDLNGKTRWTLNASFASADDRDTAVNMGFTRTVSQSADRMAAYLATL